MNIMHMVLNSMPESESLIGSSASDRGHVLSVLCLLWVIQ